MIIPDISDFLASFSPSSVYFSVASADGRVKIWDTLKGHLQKEYVEFDSSSDESKILAESKRGHLSLDYKCMKWVQLERKKKKLLGSSLLVLGTGGGDVLAVEVSSGQLKWRVRDCHPGGVNAISCSRQCSYIYTAGVDGMVSQIDCSTGDMNRKFRSSTKGISALAVSPDGNMLAVAAGQLKIFSCSENKKIQKFSGHPVSVRCIIFSEEGNYILSSGVGEKHIAIWRLDGGKKKSAICVLSMEHPAIFLDCQGSDTGGSKVQGLYVIALSEMGMCYFWHGNSVEELQNRRPTKISLSFESSTLNRNKNQAMLAAKLDRIVGPASALVHIAHGSFVKPTFEKCKVEYGVDLCLNTSQDGVLLPTNHSYISKKGEVVHAAVTTLDRANAEDAILPLPKLHFHEKKRKHGMPGPDADFERSKVDLVTSKSKNSHSPTQAQVRSMDVEETICIEERLKEAGIIDGKPKPELEGSSDEFTDTIMQEGLDFTVNVNLPRRKMRSQISTMSPGDACKTLEFLVSLFKIRSASPKQLLPWIYYILVIHGQFIISQESSSGVFDSLEKLIRLKSDAIHPLLKLSGRLQLIMTQIDKAGMSISNVPSERLSECDEDEEEDEEEDEDIYEMVYGVDNETDSDD